MLSPEQVDKLRITLFTSGWKEVMEPAIANRANQALKALSMFPQEREKQAFADFQKMTDDQLRCILSECQWVLGVWRNELAIADHNRRLEEMDRQNGTEAGLSQTQPS